MSTMVIMRWSSTLACILVLAAVSGCDSGGGKNDLFAPSGYSGLPDDIPYPPDDVELHGGAGGSTYYFSPNREDVSADLAATFLDFYEEELPGEGWTLSDKNVADDRAWTAAWTKSDRTVRITFSREFRTEPVSLIIEQCPPAVTGSCNAGRLFSLGGDS